jgi:peptide/nickel transport system substrate-binding protein
MNSKLTRKFALGVAAAAVSLGGMLATPASAQSTLKVVMHSDLKIVDPIWTTAYMSRNYGYMVYDTLFAMDEKLNILPQMVGDYKISGDKLTYTFTLRDGLKWHDGKPVTSADAIASIKRWGSKDSMGQMLMKFTKEMKAVNDGTFQLILNEPFGLVLMALAKPSSNVPFMMPERIANTPSKDQISEYIGSGPFVFKDKEWKPGDKAIFAKFNDYKSRSETSSWASGAKQANFDRVEWISIKDHQTAVNAIMAGEIDFIESPPTDLLPLLKDDNGVTVKNLNPLGLQYMFRLNHLHPPFNDIKARRAALAAINQEDFLKATIGNPEYYKVCGAMFICGTPLATNKGADIVLKSDFKLAKKLLAESSYDGRPIVIMQSTDVDSLNNLGPVAASLLKKAGFKIDLQAMDWQTLVSRRSKRETPDKNGWNVFMTAWTAADILNPIMAAGFNAGCDKAWFGWPCDAEMEALRDKFARETDLKEQAILAEKIQVRAMEVVTHAHAGQWYRPSAWRANLTGVLSGPAPFFWNVARK